jgi:hypothetical protein
MQQVLLRWFRLALALAISTILLILLNVLFTLNWCLHRARVFDRLAYMRNVQMLLQRFSIVGAWILDQLVQLHMTIYADEALQSRLTAFKQSHQDSMDPVVCVSTYAFGTVFVATSLVLLCFCESFCVLTPKRCPDWLVLTFATAHTYKSFGLFFSLTGPARHLPLVGWASRFAETAQAVNMSSKMRAFRIRLIPAALFCLTHWRLTLCVNVRAYHMHCRSLWRGGQG